MEKILQNKKLLAAICGGGAAVVLLAVVLVFQMVIRPNQLYQEATEQFAAGNYAEAYEALQKVPKSKNDTAELLPYYTAHAAFAEGDYATAAEQFAAVGDQWEECPDYAAYSQAQVDLSNKEYGAAYNAFMKLGDFLDSADMLPECRYRMAVDLFAQKDYAGALERFSALGDYKDSAGQGKECSYQMAVQTLEAKAYGDAYSAFAALGDYKDAVDMLSECRYRMAVDLFAQKDYAGALERFSALGDYKDSVGQGKECSYQLAVQTLEAKAYGDAYSAFAALGEYKDAVDMLSECRYQQAAALAEENTVESLTQAVELFTQIGTYKDAPQKVTDTTAALEEAKRVPYSPSAAAFFDIDCADPANIHMKAYKAAAFDGNNFKIFSIPSGIGTVSRISIQRYQNGLGDPVQHILTASAGEICGSKIYGGNRFDTYPKGLSVGPDYAVSEKWNDGAGYLWSRRDDSDYISASAVRFGNTAISMVDNTTRSAHDSFINKVRLGRTVSNFDGMPGGAIIFGEYEYFDLSSMRFSAAEHTLLTLTSGVVLSVQTSCTGGDLTETYKGMEIYTKDNGAYIRATRDVYIWCGAYNAAQARQIIRDLIDNYHRP